MTEQLTGNWSLNFLIEVPLPSVSVESLPTYSNIYRPFQCVTDRDTHDWKIVCSWENTYLVLRNLDFDTFEQQICRSVCVTAQCD